MQIDRSAPATRSGFDDDRADPAIARLIEDIETLYATATPPPATAALLRRRIARGAVAAPVPLPVRRLLPRRAFAAAAALALAVIGGILISVRPANTVSAQEIVERAQHAVESAPANIRSYHLRATLTEPGGGAQTRSTSETWYGGNGRVRHERETRGANGQTSRSGMVTNGSQVWLFTTANGRTEVQQYTRDANAPAEKGVDRKFAPDEDITGLADLLAQYSAAGDCPATARQQGDSVVAGRPVYVIEVTHGNGCHAKPGQSPIARSRLSVDRQSFLPLKSETIASNGSVVTSYEVTSISYDLSLPESTFTYTPPPGAVINPARLNDNALPADVDADCVRREIAAGRKPSALATCRRPNASPAPAASPRP